MSMEAPRRPLWHYLSIARTPIPTRPLLLITVVLVGLLVFATITERNGPRPLPAPASSVAPMPLGNGQFVFSPRSGRVQQGIPYRFTMLTHCGLSWPVAVDFDGSFWQPINLPDDGGNPPPGFSNPTDQGIMILRPDGEAEYHSSHGRLVDFQRRAGTVTASPCS